MTDGNFEIEVLFILRSNCLCKMGNFVDADRDADYVLRIDPYSVKGLIAKAEAQYNLGSFEHALKYFHRFVCKQSAAKNVNKCNSFLIIAGLKWKDLVMEVLRRV